MDDGLILKYDLIILRQIQNKNKPDKEPDPEVYQGRAGEKDGGQGEWSRLVAKYLYKDKYKHKHKYKYKQKRKYKYTSIFEGWWLNRAAWWRN